MESKLATLLKDGKLKCIKDSIPDDGLDNGAYAEWQFFCDVMSGKIDVVKMCPARRQISYPDGHTLTYLITGPTSVEYVLGNDETIYTAEIELANCIGALVAGGEVLAILPRFLLEVG